MKKIALTIAIVLGLGMTTYAERGGLFQRGADQRVGIYGDRNGGGVMTPKLPGHGYSENQDAPLGSGITVLLGLGVAYLLGEKRNKE